MHRFQHVSKIGLRHQAIKSPKHLRYQIITVQTVGNGYRVSDLGENRIRIYNIGAPGSSSFSTLKINEKVPEREKNL